MFSGVNGVFNLTENGFVSNSDKIYARENGKNIPDIAAIKYPMMLFLGIIFFMNSSET